MSSTYRNDLRGAYRLREGGGGVFNGHVGFPRCDGMC